MTKFGFTVVSSDPFEAVEQGVRAEKAGFYSLWVPDHSIDIDGDRLDPWTVLSYIAAKTERIRLCSAVTDTQRIHPSKTAHIVSCLDQLSKGRAVLGIGAGEAMILIPYGITWVSPQVRAQRLAEAVSVIKLLFTATREKPANFSGKYYQLRQGFLNQLPFQKPHPLIYVGAMSSKRALKVAGELGDGWFPWFNTPDTYKERLEVVREAAKNSGRDASEIKPALQLKIALPQNDEERKQALLAGKVSLLIERTVLLTLGYDSYAFMPDLRDYQNILPTKDLLSHLREAAKKISDEAVHACMVIGMEDLERKVSAFVKAGAEEISFINLFGKEKALETINALGRFTRSFG
jgi:alkanesulfonate monooxygenase SsuD/methylene tetrahydromethanopterin reductase-like flavin-dependent oxidoreductase (luciferase family)